MHSSKLAIVGNVHWRFGISGEPAVLACVLLERSPLPGSRSDNLWLAEKPGRTLDIAMGTFRIVKWIVPLREVSAASSLPKTSDARTSRKRVMAKFNPPTHRAAWRSNETETSASKTP